MADKITVAKDGFTAAYLEFLKTALPLAAKARRESLLGLANDIDKQKAAKRDIFHYGLAFAVDGVSWEIIDEILSNIIAQEQDGAKSKFMNMQKQAVFCIFSGYNEKVMHSILNSFAPISIEEENG